MVFFSLPFYLFVYHCLAKNERNHPFQAPLEDFKGQNVYVLLWVFSVLFFFSRGIDIKWDINHTEVNPPVSPETSF